MNSESVPILDGSFVYLFFQKYFIKLDVDSFDKFIVISLKHLYSSTFNIETEMYVCINKH